VDSFSATQSYKESSNGFALWAYFIQIATDLGVACTAVNTIVKSNHNFLDLRAKTTYLVHLIF